MNVTMLRAIPAIVYAMVATGAAAQAVDESALEALEKTSPVVQPVVAEPAGCCRVAVRNAAHFSQPDRCRLHSPMPGTRH
jgi:hypothetical protein